MQIALALIFVPVILLLPALADWGCKRVKVLDLLGPVVLCYAGGMLLSLAFGPLSKPIAEPISQAMIPLAIPLLLMGRNLWVEMRQTGRSLQAFGLACGSACIMAFVMGLIFQDIVPESWKIAGMLTGVYTGSVPNLVSVGKILNVASHDFLLVQASDVVTGGIFLLVMLSLMKPLMSRFLKPYEGDKETGMDVALPQHFRWRDVLIATGASALIAGAAIGLSFLIFQSLSLAWVMAGLTIGGLLASTTPLHRLQGTDTAGEYLIQVFCASVGCQVQFSQLLGASGPILLFTACIMLSTIGLHMLLAKLLGHDVDTTLMASAATIYGPPFVAPVAEAIGNRALIGPGLTLGVLGYVFGTGLGLGVAYALKMVTGV